MYLLPEGFRVLEEDGRERKANKEEAENLRKADILQLFDLLQFYFRSQP